MKMRCIGKYQLLGLLGRGGMGRVYKVLDLEQNSLMAMKVLRPSETMLDFLGVDELKRRFIYEAFIMKKLKHRHVADVFDVGEHKGLSYLVQEYLCLNLGLLIGESDRVEHSTRPLSPLKALDIASQVLDALSGFHESGLIHRDIKPENVMLSKSGEVKIIDFGLSRFLQDKEKTPPGMIVGSPYYAAPEQIDHPERADQRSDLYSAGVVLYRMVTGNMPDVNMPVISESPLLGQGWNIVLKKALAPDPGDRFPDAAVMNRHIKSLKLDWEKRRDQVCSLPGVNHQPVAGRVWQVRSKPVHAGKTDPAALGNLNTLMQPRAYVDNKFHRTDQGIEDHVTCLIWSSDVSLDPLNFEQAREYIRKLNEQGSLNELKSSWRLPTVDELMSLLGPRQSLEDFCGPDLWQLKDSSWLWSADSQTRTKNWIVDMDQGAVLAQDRMCRFHVLPVRLWR